MSTRRRLDIGVSSYRNPHKLRVTLESIEVNSHTDWRCFIVHNPSQTEDGIQALQIARQAAMSNTRFIVVPLDANVGYAGAVNEIFALASTPYVAYLDNDVEIQTPGWDERLCRIMDAHEEVGWAFPGEGHYGFHNGKYRECLWNAGYAWVARKDALYRSLIEYEGGHRGPMDTELGHHEEVDLMIRLRMAGYQLACDPAVSILHHQSATNDPAAQARIHAGVVRWMNKWNRYFCGDVLKYPDPDQSFDAATGHFTSGEGYDPRALQYTDWHPVSLYMERWTLAQFPEWNKAPRTVMTSAGEMDVIDVLKPTSAHRGRAI